MNKTIAEKLFGQSKGPYVSHPKLSKVLEKIEELKWIAFTTIYFPEWPTDTGKWIAWECEAEDTKPTSPPPPPKEKENE